VGECTLATGGGFSSNHPGPKGKSGEWRKKKTRHPKGSVQLLQVIFPLQIEFSWYPCCLFAHIHSRIIHNLLRHFILLCIYILLNKPFDDNYNYIWYINFHKLRAAGSAEILSPCDNEDHWKKTQVWRRGPLRPVRANSVL
jgi:hypothetical protein